MLPKKIPDQENREEKLKKIRQGITSIRLLSKYEQDNIQKKLSKLPDPQNIVRSDFSLRNGIFRNFAYSYSR